MVDDRIQKPCNFAGSERDFVILSTVRTRPEAMIDKHDWSISARRKHIGFVSDYHQINVAITRARSGLCIVGKWHERLF